ncbi:MAG: outer membrane beta-barrel family protein [Bacteroidota bacterium]
MRKYLLLAISLFIVSLSAFSQKMNIGGNVQDTIAKTPLPSAVVIAVRLRDSVLVAHTRSDATGFFTLKNMKIDTVQIIISHPKFGDQSYYVFGSSDNNTFDFGKIILPSKSHNLNEIVIYAYKDPVYYKGDTLIYTADSFKVKPNATVEDLLKKLPGIKVDAQGKITSQGKKVDQVLVDGDEFFGTDPTMATQNLNAKAVESVQVYEKKNENESDDGNETLQIMNLKLKDAAKKGYFGKVTGASDFEKFYEGEFLANKFKNKQKISVFALGSNTPRSSLGWDDMYKFGLSNEDDWQPDEDGDYNWNGVERNQGIPQTLKSGIYYTDKISPKTKLNFNYTYNNNQLNANSETASQYFLTDTSYRTTNRSNSKQLNESHSINFGIVQTLDSLTELVITPKLEFNSSTTDRYEITEFFGENDTLARRTEIRNKNKANGYSINTTAKLTRNFKKKERLLVASYNNILNNNTSDGTLVSDNVFFNNPFIANDSINQKKNNSGNSRSNNATLTYFEPITKKIKLEFEYNFNFNVGQQEKKALNFANGEYALEDALFTNNFENVRMTNRFGAKFIYEVKKQRFTVGSRFRQVSIANNNLITQQTIKQTVNNILPYLKYMYKFSETSRFNFSYKTNSSQPSIDQLQPIQDNTNPNQIKKGNPNLLPTFKQNFEMYYNFYKPISGKYLWSSASYSTTNNGFSNSIIYDTIGRTITTSVNVNGNYDASANLGAVFPFFSKLLELNPNLNFNYNSYTSFINNQTNITKTANTSSRMDVVVKLDTLEFSAGYGFDYNSPSSTLNAANNKPYTSQKITASLNLKLPLKFSLETNAEYVINSQRAQGYNINYFLWNASLKKIFLKNENLIVSIDATDILNQNINTSRTIQDNVITDNKTNIISRYILLKAIFKFNSNKTKDDEEEY